jgi:uncharacterized membrane protein YdjX (TVP38/TMEM64 family)
MIVAGFACVFAVCLLMVALTMVFPPFLVILLAGGVGYANRKR